jgi:glycolate oxidase
MTGYMEKLKKIVGGENVKTDRIELICYSRDMSVHQGIPDAIVFPSSTEQVSEILKLANKEKVPVTPRGSGTSVVGAVLPCKGGIVLDMSGMNRIKEINLDDRYAVVEPGVICGQLNAAVGPKYFFPPDPGSSAICSLGGMISTNASGLRAAKYGTTKDYVMALQVVLPTGEIIRVGTKAPKTSSGYEMTRLFVCSEGTLGVITEATLKILPSPESTAMAMACFKNIESAGEAVEKIFASGITLSACEILDRISIDVLNKAMNLKLPEVDGMLLMGIDGPKGIVVTQVNRITGICKEVGGTDVKWSDNPAEIAEMWKGRSGLVSAFSRYKPGYRLIPIAEDFGVPMSKIPEAILGIQKIAKENDMIIATFGHVGDGNLHSTFIADVRSAKEWVKIKKVGLQLIKLALTLDGTITAEHATGLAKAPFIEMELGNSINVMRAVKRALDPNGILNPGKMALDGEKHDVYDYFAFRDIVGKGKSPLPEAITNEILACVMCGFCRAVCPTFEQTKLESRNARGRVVLAFSILSGAVKPSEEIADKFYQCSTCMNCTFACPSRIKVSDIIENVRQYMVEHGYSRPEHKRIWDNIEKTGNPFGEDQNARKELQSAAATAGGG